MPEPILPDPDDDTQAGELALGVLAGDERAAALRRVVADPAFAVAVENWRMRLAPLLDGIAPVSPPADAWDAIERSTYGAASSRVTRWRAAALAMTAVAAALATVLVMRPDTPVASPLPAPAPMLAQVAGASGTTLVSAQYDATSGAFRVRTSNLPTGARVPELWLIVGDAPPRSLGIVPLNASTIYVPPEAMRRIMADGATIAVTMEPRASAPHVAPSGSILGTARLTTV